MLQHDFSGVLDRIRSKLVNVSKRTEETRLLYNAGDLPAAYDAALRLEEASEKMVLLTRALPAFTGNPHAMKDVDALILATVKPLVEFTLHGWFYVKIPALLPKKGSGSADYIRSILYPAMRSFFADREPVRYADCILAFRHIYDRNRPDRRKRDHDNIEINMVTDIIAMYVLSDDNPDVCSVFQTSSEGSENITEIYVVPRADFPAWLVEKGVCKTE